MKHTLFIIGVICTVLGFAAAVQAADSTQVQITGDGNTVSTVVNDQNSNSLSSGFIIKNFVATVDIGQNGQSEILEKITADFGQNPHHGIYRTLPLTYSSYLYGSRASGIKLRDVSWQHEGDSASVAAPYTTAIAESGLTLKIGDAGHVDTGAVTYTIHYQAAAVQAETSNGQQFLWNVTGRRWTVPIEHAKATITASGIWTSPLCYAPSDTQTSCQTEAHGAVMTASAQNLQPGQELTAGGLLPSGTIQAVSPVRRALWLQIVLPCLLPLLTLAWLIWQRMTMSARKNARAIIPLYEPPTLEPGLADAFREGELYGQPIPATLIDMAHRGELTIEEKKGLFWHKNYLLHLKKRPAASGRPLAEVITSVLFDQNGKEQSLDDLHKDTIRAAQLQRLPSEAGWQWLKQQGFVTNENTYSWNNIKHVVFGVVLALIGGLFIALMQNGLFALSIFWGLGLLASGILLLFTRLFRRGSELTEKGLAMYRQVMGFYMFMHVAERYRQQWLEKEGELDRFLPWAMVFGLTKEWLKKLDQMGATFTPPVWYVGSGGFDSSTFASNFSSAMSSFSSAGTSSGGAGSGGGGGGGGGW